MAWLWSCSVARVSCAAWASSCSCLWRWALAISRVAASSSARYWSHSRSRCRYCASLARTLSCSRVISACCSRAPELSRAMQSSHWLSCSSLTFSSPFSFPVSARAFPASFSAASRSASARSRYALASSSALRSREVLSSSATLSSLRRLSSCAVSSCCAAMAASRSRMIYRSLTVLAVCVSASVLASPSSTSRRFIRERSSSSWASSLPVLSLCSLCPRSALLNFSSRSVFSRRRTSLASRSRARLRLSMVTSCWRSALSASAGAGGARRARQASMRSPMTLKFLMACTSHSDSALSKQNLYPSISCRSWRAPARAAARAERALGPREGWLVRSLWSMRVMLLRTWLMLARRACSWLSKEMTSSTFSLFSRSASSMIMGEASSSSRMLEERFSSDPRAACRTSDSETGSSSNIMWKALMGRPEDSDDSGERQAPSFPMFFHNGPRLSINQSMHHPHSKHSLPIHRLHRFQPYYHTMTSKNKVDYTSCAITDDKMEAIGKRSLTISVLNLNRNHISKKGILTMGRAKWSNLEELCLFNNSIGNKGCKYLSQMALGAIRSLNLSKNGIGRAGVSHLHKGEWPRLQKMYVHVSRLRDGGVWLLVKAHWPQLTALGITSSKVTHSEMMNLVLSERQLVDTLWLLNNDVSPQAKAKINRMLELKFSRVRLETARA